MYSVLFEALENFLWIIKTSISKQVKKLLDDHKYNKNKVRWGVREWLRDCFRLRGQKGINEMEFNGKNELVSNTFRGQILHEKEIIHE